MSICCAGIPLPPLQMKTNSDSSGSSSVLLKFEIMFVSKGDPQLWFKNAVMYKIDKIGLCNLQLFEALKIEKGK